MEDVLFIRKYPVSLAPGYIDGLRKSVYSLFGRGQSETVNGHKVTFFFPGYGRHIRDIPESIINEINSGRISDIVDFGAGGALDPLLKVGDLILSNGEVCYDGGEQLVLNSRARVEEIVRKIALEDGRSFYKRKILTSAKIVAGRKERLQYLEQTDCGVVQMEHYWFIDKLRRLVDPKRFQKLHFTHIELVADQVPDRKSTSLEGITSLFCTLDMCIFRNDFHLGRLKKRFLKDFLK